MMPSNTQRNDSTPAAATSAAAAPWGVSRAAMNIFVILLFALQAIASWRHFVSSGTSNAFGLLVVNTLFVTLFLFRSPAKVESESPGLWILGIAGTVLPLLMRPGDGSILAQTGDILQIAGFALLATSLLSLRRSFGIVAANRGVRSGGLYRFVRHPVYFSELTLVLGFVLANPTRTNILIWLSECVLQYARACVEERLLCSDPAYRTYRTQVRYRLIPGLI
jgi:protein-S-isoprenylcysteine O-methyltransferase Ste14